MKKTIYSAGDWYNVVEEKETEMKIRTDYVSNSSSSSFMLVGKSFNAEDLVKIAKHNKIGDEDDTDYEDWLNADIVSELEDIFKDLHFEYGLETMVKISALEWSMMT